MDSPESPLPVEGIEVPSLIGQTVEGNVFIDDGVWLDEVRAIIGAKNPLSDSDKIGLAEKYVTERLKDATYTFTQEPEVYNSNKAAIDRVMLSEEPRSVSEVLNGGYGVCPDFQAVELAVLDYMGVEAFLAGKPSKQHLFLFVKQGDEWVVSDPFAENYFKARGSNNKRFSSDYYQGNGIQFFQKTSRAGVPPEIKPLPVRSPESVKSPVISLDELKSRLKK